MELCDLPMRIHKFLKIELKLLYHINSWLSVPFMKKWEKWSSWLWKRELLVWFHSPVWCSSITGNTSNSNILGKFSQIRILIGFKRDFLMTVDVLGQKLRDSHTFLSLHVSHLLIMPLPYHHCSFLPLQSQLSSLCLL